MKILRFSDSDNQARFGALIDQERGEVAVLDGIPYLDGITHTGESLSLDAITVLAPLASIGKVICIGKNYADHAAEMNSELPTEPIIFLKPPTTVIDPGAQIIWPKMSERVDYEGELTVVIGKSVRNIEPEESESAIFGYTIGNDVTARDLQHRDGQWTRAKGFDTFCPIGPWIETDFTPGHQRLETRVNGEIRQSGTISDLIFKVPTIVAFLSQVMTLLPGDVILTGTPAGIGPMKDGDSVSISIEGIGTLSNPFVKRSKR